LSAAVATMLSCFQDGSIPGKTQFGSGSWRLDHKEGTEWPVNALSNIGLLSRLIGMLTDSRSFLSYPRHEGLRRILSNLSGRDIENGVFPGIPAAGEMVENICYNNVKNHLRQPMD
jgi:glucuronate isomerase